mgnify:CR=1 FL=1|tara:strand:- start:4666 stop:5694 length:1029 start_codon:yes stop_codon:yes gene_type:complete
MKILVTGNLGYIGTALTNVLSENSFNFDGLDIGYFKNCNLTKNNQNFNQLYQDIRFLKSSDIKGYDTVIHLAALSNDPLGEFNPRLTKQINYEATINLAEIAKRNGVKKFIFLSTQSLYGISNTSRKVKENDDKNPITEYAKTKWESEKELIKMNNEDFVVTFLRPSTVFGFSSRLRCDIVYNNFLANAFTNKKIEILSDGTPWRPVVHIQDVCNAIIACINAPSSIINGEAFNIGYKNGNFKVKDLAFYASKCVSNSKIFYSDKPSTDERTYRVSFEKIYEKLANFYKPKWDLYEGGIEIIKFFDEINFNSVMFEGHTCNRLKTLKKLLQEKDINENLEFI